MLIDALTPIPRGYGIAYRSVDSDTCAVYPLPFNWIVGLTVSWWRWLRRGPLVYVPCKNSISELNRFYNSGADYALILARQELWVRFPEPEDRQLIAQSLMEIRRLFKPVGSA